MMTGSRRSVRSGLTVTSTKRFEGPVVFTSELEPALPTRSPPALVTILPPPVEEVQLVTVAGSVTIFFGSDDGVSDVVCFGMMPEGICTIWPPMPVLPPLCRPAACRERDTEVAVNLRAGLTQLDAAIVLEAKIEPA